VSALYNRYENADKAGIDNITTQLGSLRFTRGIGKGLSLYLGYSMTETRYSGASLRGHGPDIGLDFTQSRGIQVTRRTHLTFGGGVNGYRSSAETAQRFRTRYVATGNANLTREIGRAWRTGLGYARGLNFIERFREPILTDGITGDVSGLLGRRLEVQGNVGVAFSKVGFVSTANGYKTYTAMGTLTTGVTRFMALGVTFAHYQYQFDRTTDVPLGLDPRMGRNSVRVYLSAWAPIFQRLRRPDASR
jgi:hypothetical protein